MLRIRRLRIEVESTGWLNDQHGDRNGSGSTAPGQRHDVVTFELEIEVIDAARLIAEGHKERNGDPNNVFDKMLSNILDTARILIRNAPPPG